jgi:two-component system, OmpR family, phosphate regulon sensor histidine kinase PhoR
MERGIRSRVILLVAVLVAVGIIAFFTVRTTLQLDRLGKQSVLEGSLALATEKARRLDGQLVEQDNVVRAVADPARLDEVADRWLPTAKRETPTVRAIVILDETATVLSYTSRAANGWIEDDAFRRLLTATLISEFALDQLPPDELRHLHKRQSDQGYLLSYQKHIWEGRTYVSVA